MTNALQAEVDGPSQAAREIEIIPASITSRRVTESEKSVEEVINEFKMLDGLVNAGIEQMVLHAVEIAKIRQRLKPSIGRIHELLTANSQGMRTDLKDGNPRLTWGRLVQQQAKPRIKVHVRAPCS